eukprot:1996753-Ditylum_brightwellii.AAC.1
MAYRRFTNLQEKFRGDLVAKVNNGVKSLDLMECPRNCSRHCFVNGACVYKGLDARYAIKAMPEELRTT